MELHIAEELKYVTEELGRTQGQPYDIQNLLQMSVSNIATRIIFGQRFEYSTQQLQNLQFSEYMAKARLVSLAPFLKVGKLLNVRLSDMPQPIAIWDRS